MKKLVKKVKVIPLYVVLLSFTIIDGSIDFRDFAAFAGDWMSD